MRWNVSPADMDITLGWTPEMELILVEADNEIGSHMLVSEAGPVRVACFGDSWPEGDTKCFLKRIDG
jgi:hypothetical protein